jgi:hypothetical protein
MANQKVWIALLIGCIATAGILSYFLIVNLGQMEILIKDAPYDDLVSINVDIAAVEIHKEDEARWIPLMNGQEKQINCSVTGEVEKICRSDLAGGTYDLIRIKFNHIRLRFNNDSLYELDKYENQNQVQNLWLEIPINFTYDGVGGQILFDITVNNNYEAVVTVLNTVS